MIMAMDGHCAFLTKICTLMVLPTYVMMNI